MNTTRAFFQITTRAFFPNQGTFFQFSKMGEGKPPPSPPLVATLQNAGVISTLVGFQKDIAHITVSLLKSKAGAKQDKGEVIVALLNDILKGLEFLSS